MKWQNVSPAVQRLHPSAIAFPDYVPPCLLEGAAISGPAQIIDQTPKDVETRLLEWERLLLLQQAHKAKRQRRNSRIYLDKARAVMARILSKGR